MHCLIYMIIFGINTQEIWNPYTHHFFNFNDISPENSRKTTILGWVHLQFDFSQFHLTNSFPLLLWSKIVYPLVEVFLSFFTSLIVTLASVSGFSLFHLSLSSTFTAVSSSIPKLLSAFRTQLFSPQFPNILKLIYHWSNTKNYSLSLLFPICWKAWT